jgi:uncharacterized protein YjbI with pentapeptide repeats
MSRMAWEAHRLAEKEKALQVFDVRRILHDELQLDDDAALEQTTQMGVLLTLQADLEGGASRLLFGHQSFREFLVARYWQHCLRKLATKDHDDRMEAERPLIGARLIRDSDESFEFLTLLLGQLPKTDQRLILAWAERAFNDDRMGTGARSISTDERPPLRHAALGVASYLAEQLDVAAVVAKSPTTLRSVLAWFWYHEKSPRVLGSRLLSHGAQLADCRLMRSDLSNADLSGADLTSALLRHSTAKGARFVNARMAFAVLRGADLSESNFTQAWIRYIIAIEATLVGCDFGKAIAMSANFTRANLRGSSFENARLGGAKFDGAIVANCNFSGARFRSVEMLRDVDGDHRIEEFASFTGSDLTGAVLEGADLRNVNFYGANLTNARLAGADLRGATLDAVQWDGADLEGVRRDRKLAP